MRWFVILPQALLALIVVYVTGLLYINFPFIRHPTYVTLPDNISIDDVIRGYWNYDPGPLQYFSTSCRPQNNLVFIKCVLCSSADVDMVFRRYGYLNNLSMVLPVGESIYLGWPRPISVSDFRPSSRGYDMLTEPAIYNSTFMRGLMKQDAVFFAMIRHPLHLFASTLQHFFILGVANLTYRHNAAGVQAFLRNIHKYDVMFRDHALLPNRSCFPYGFSLTKNLLSHCVGIPLGFPEDRQNIFSELDAVRQYIYMLDSEMLLVMIMEYVDESLVLLKRLMCWSFKDILHLGSGEKNDSANILSMLTHHDRDLHRQWSSADYLLYEHFNTTFWSTVGRHGEDFEEDLIYYRHIQNQVRWFCRNVTPYGESYIQFPETRMSPAFSVNSEDCKLMEAPLLDMLKARYQQQESQHIKKPTTTTGKVASRC